MSPAVPKLAPVTASVAAYLVMSSAAAAAYGPVAPLRPQSAGGFSLVMASRTIGPSGGALSATRGHVVIQVRVRPHTLNGKVQFTLTRPRGSLPAGAIPEGMRLLSAFALTANRPDGTPLSGRFSRTPAQIIVRDPAIKRGVRALAWNSSSGRFARVSATVRGGQAVVKTRHPEELLIVSPG